MGWWQQGQRERQQEGLEGWWGWTGLSGELQTTSKCQATTMGQAGHEGRGMNFEKNCSVCTLEWKGMPAGGRVAARVRLHA